MRNLNARVQNLENNLPRRSDGIRVLRTIVRKLGDGEWRERVILIRGPGYSLQREKGETSAEFLERADGMARKGGFNG